MVRLAMRSLLHFLLRSIILASALEISDQNQTKHDFGFLFKGVWNEIANNQRIILSGNWYLAGEGGMILDGIMLYHWIKLYN